MPAIYDNIEKKLLEGLKKSLRVSHSADFCVGYFNLRGWSGISEEIDGLPLGENSSSPACRLIVGMSGDAGRAVRNYYGKSETEATQKTVVERKKSFAASLAKQLTYGIPTADDETGLRKLAGQLRSGRLKVRFFGSYPLHAKLYLVRRDDPVNPVTGYVGSSNLTLAGLERQGELNIDVLDGDAAAKLARWFENRWEDRWCLDITEELAGIVENSWAGGPVKPYEIYVKTAYELSKEAIEGSREFTIPGVFRNRMLEFQEHAVLLAAERLSRHDGVIVSDVVGLGKTLVASAVAKVFQEDRGGNVLVICPPKLKDMWEDYLHHYVISGKVLSLGKTGQLKEMKRYPLVIIDESHNLRNRETTRYAQVHRYIRDNDSRVILLTATPYNKEFRDIANQLRLFAEPDSDLGIRPEDHIRACGGADKFKRDHPSTLISSLAAFERSGEVEDWRELMRLFMVRRTRSHIKQNYADYDEERKQHFLTFSGGERYYFPDRKPKCARFGLDERDSQDQYAALYSEEVVENMIGRLSLPRYGIGVYLLHEYQQDTLPENVSEGEENIIRNLSRAGYRLIGFTRSQLFKRLESSGPAFLVSVKRHLVRNAVYLAAIESGGRFPVGDVFAPFDGGDPVDDDAFGGEGDGAVRDYRERGREIYEALSSGEVKARGRLGWISVRYFDTETVRKRLLGDCEILSRVLEVVPDWDAGSDRKLDALYNLCGKTHGDEKLLVFTQFKDTAEYLHRELEKLGVERVAKVHGSTDDISGCVRRFSPVSNGRQSGGADEIRVLITTDALSEGQNLQDARVVVNFDLPWAIIRLVQRAGRVDRMGQKAREILCYCFLPEDGIERVIRLRERLAERIGQNAEVVGSDERFFEGDRVNLEQVYNETVGLEADEGETDLISRAFDIWRQATRSDPGLKDRIEGLPDVVYSSKKGEDGGALAYVKTSDNRHILAQVSAKGEVVSQSQSKILNLLECAPDEPTAAVAENHHDLVAAAVSYVREGRADAVGAGQLGGQRSVRNRVYSRLTIYLEEREGTLFAHNRDLKVAVEDIYHHPLKETARDRLRRQLRAGIPDDDLASMVLTMWESGELSAAPQKGEPVEPRIICSMGLSG